MPPACAALARRYRRTVYARALDTGKRRIASARAMRGDGYEGPVIVKTNFNCFGLPEREGRERAMPRLLRSAMRRAAPAVGRLPWWISGNVGSASHPVVAMKRMVPASIWFDPRFVVRRYAPERAGDGEPPWRNSGFSDP